MTSTGQDGMGDHRRMMAALSSFAFRPSIVKRGAEISLFSRPLLK
jgi:hypothetical protein